MADEKTQALFGRFFTRARAYLDRPGVMAGLELDEITVRVRQCAFTELKDEAMGRNLEALLKAIRYQDLDQARTLVDTVTAGAGGHGIEAV